MYPDYEKNKLIDDWALSHVANENLLSSFGFSHNNIDNIKLSNQVEIYINNTKYTRHCQLLQDIERNLYLKFKTISAAIEEYMVPQIFYKSEQFKCLSCGVYFFKSENVESCCSMRNNIVEIYDASIYKICFLNIDNYSTQHHNSKEEFAITHFSSIVDTMMLGDPI
jgi:hypothetical protein